MVHRRRIHLCSIIVKVRPLHPLRRMLLLLLPPQSPKALRHQWKRTNEQKLPPLIPYLIYLMVMCLPLWPHPSLQSFRHLQQRHARPSHLLPLGVACLILTGMILHPNRRHLCPLLHRSVPRLAEKMRFLVYFPLLRPRNLRQLRSPSSHLPKVLARLYLLSLAL